MNKRIFRIKNRIIVRITNVWLYLFVAFSILFSGATITSAYGLLNINLHRLLYLIYIVIGVIVAKRSIGNVHNWHRALGWCVLVVVLLFMTNLINNPSSSFNFLVRLAWGIIIFGICFYEGEKTKKIIALYAEFIFIIAVISLIVFLIIAFFNPPSVAIISDEGYNYLKYFGFYYVLPNERLNLVFINGCRMQSIFWEPGMFAVHLVLAIYIELFEKHQKKFLRIIIFLFCLMLTYSTTGIILGGVLFVVYMCTSDQINLGIRVLIVVPLICIAMYVFYSIWIEKSADKFVGSSYGNRMSDLVLGFKLFLFNIFTGIGYNNTEAYARAFEIEYSVNRGSSNGLMIWMYSTGIVGALSVLIPFFKGLFLKRIRVKDYLFLITFLLLSMTEPIFTSPVMIFMICIQYYKVYGKRGSQKETELMLQESINYAREY